MAEPFKLLLNPGSVADMAHHLRRSWPRFDAARFESLALDGLDGLEFKGRARHLMNALDATLPADFSEAAAVLEGSLGPPTESDEPGDLRTGPAGLAGWPVWPLTEYIAHRGLAHPQRSLQALHAMTQRFTAEWALRPFLLTHPALVFETLQRWTGDPSPHVRRLVSEGSRPRLPWGLQLKPLIADPAPTLPLLAALQDDPSAYVRRSVANHLNDIAKDHPGLVARWLETHLPAGSPERRALLRHASRTLIKQGHAPTLAAWGLGRAYAGSADLAISPASIRLGEAVMLTVRLQAGGRRAQDLVIDYAVHYVKADGRSTPKVFKGWTLTLAAGETRELTRRHAVRPITTRRYHAGRHLVELQVNGQPVAQAAFDLRL